MSCPAAQDIISTHESAERRGNDINELHPALDGSYASAPLQTDAEP